MDLIDYNHLFQEEGRDTLKRLSEGLLALERSPDDLSMAHETFRALHSFKGMASTMGADDAAALAHAMESVLDSVRHGALALTPALVDHLLVSWDALEALLEDEYSPGHEALIGDLEAALAHQTVSLSSDAYGAPAETEVPSVSMEGAREFRIAITLDSACMLRSARALMILSALGTLGIVLDMTPPPEELECCDPAEAFLILLRSAESTNAVSAVVAAMGDVESVTVTPLEAQPGEPKAQRASTEWGEETLEAVVPADEPSRPTSTGKMVRVSVDRLDALTRMIYQTIDESDRLSHLLDSASDAAAVAAQLGKRLAALQREFLYLHLVPLDSVFSRFNRLTRDLARALGKEVQLVIAGGELELERYVVDELAEPLTHLVRNCLDHGLETPAERIASGKPAQGTLSIIAERQAGHLLLTLSDDGRGLNTERIRQKAVTKGLLSPEEAQNSTQEALWEFIFSPGFSTAPEVTLLSGRGFGMDVVKDRIRSLGGAIALESRHGLGTCFRVRLPITHHP